MKKSVVLSFVTLSSLVLTSLVQADELVPVNPESSLVTTPTETSSSKVDVPLVVDSSQPVGMVAEVAPVETVPVVVDVTSPVPESGSETSSVVDTVSSSEPSAPQVTSSLDTPLLSETNTNPSGGEDLSSKEEMKTEVKTENQMASNAEQVGAVSQVTGQVIQVVTPQAPVMTDTGQVVVGTQDSQLVVETSSGERQVVAPEQIGAKSNTDGTISVKTSKGQMVTLPKTGEVSSSVLSFVGGLVLLLTGYFSRYRRS